MWSLTTRPGTIPSTSSSRKTASLRSRGQQAAARKCAVAIFTTREKAESYLGDSGETGTIRDLDDVKSTRDFLERIAVDATAVALDATIEDGRHRAQYCFSIQTLLDKYLVNKQRRRE